MTSPITDAPRRAVDPRVRVLYVLAIAIGIFFLHSALLVGVVLGIQAIAWIVAGLPPRRLVRTVTKLWFFAAFLIASYALTPGDAGVDRWIHFELPNGWALPLNVNVAGAIAGATMVLRLLTVVVASQVARAGDVRAFGQCLRKLGAPATVATSIDITLALVGERGMGGGGGGGRGGGGGGGRDRGGEPAEAGGFLAAVKRVASTDQLARRLERRIEDAEEYANQQQLDPAVTTKIRDIAVVAGAALAMLGVRSLKVLPSIPFAPGHKLVLLTPLYVAATLASKSPFGATLAGLTMGTISFLMGDGRYGIFEIAKHIAPGVLCDLLVPLMTAGRRRPGPLAWALLGGVIAIGRFATIFAISLALGVPSLAWAFLLPGLAVHMTFGVISGWLTVPLVRSMDQWRDERDAMETPAGPIPDRTKGPEAI